MPNNLVVFKLLVFFSLLATSTIHRFGFQRRLFVFWCVSCVAAVAIVYVNSWRIKHAIGAAKRQADGTQVDGSSGGSDADGGAMERRQMSIITRKQFHILVLFVFLPGFVFHKEMLTLASSCALGVFLVAEVSGSFALFTNFSQRGGHCIVREQINVN